MTLPIEAAQVMSFESAATSRDSDGVNVAQILSALWRHRALFLSVTFSIVAFGFVIVKLLTPTYDSMVVLVLSARQDSVVNMQQSFMNMPPSDAVVRSQVDALQGRTLIDRVIDRANLMRDPEFNLYARPFHPNHFVCLPAHILPGALQTALGCRKRDASLLSPEQLKYNVATQVLKAFTVTPDPKTYSVKLDVASIDAKKASWLANLWADEYMKMQVSEKVAQDERAIASLTPRLQDLSKAVARADLAVEQYKEANHIVSLPGAVGENNTLALQEVQSLGLELSSARTARAKLEAAQQEIKRIGQNPSQALSAPAVSAAPSVENIREQEATAAAQLASLRGTYGERHPLVVSAKKQLDEVHQRLGDEVQNALREFDVQVRQSQSNEQHLQGRIGQLVGVRTGESKTMSQLSQLLSAQAGAKAVYDAFVQGTYRAAFQNGVPTPSGQIVQHADTQDFPSFPNVLIFMAVISIAALMIATGVVYAVEAGDKAFRSAGEVEAATGLRVLGMTLMAPARSRVAAILSLGVRQLAAPISRLMISEPTSALSESLRLTRAAIATSRSDRLPKTVMVASAVPGEGKTTFTLMLGRQSASAGNRTVVVEAEMRRPRFGRDLHPLPPKGLSDYLMSRATLDEIIGVDEISGMHFIAAGYSEHGFGEMLGSARMSALLHSLSAQYDLVLIDTPPAAIVADALQLSGVVDAAILLVKWASTPSYLVLDGLKKLRAANTPLVGVVMTQVDARKYKFYGHGALPYEYARSYYTGT